MRAILILILLAISTASFGQRSFYYNKFINDYWGEWKNSNSCTNIQCGYVMSGDYDNFIIYSSEDHPSKYIMKVKISNMDIDTDRKSLKERIKSKNWYQFSGTVEYFTYNNSQRFKDIIDRWPFVPNSQSGSFVQTNKVSAIIKIAPFKDKPTVYNIYIENSGIGLQLH